MLKHYLTVAYRNLKKHAQHSLMNLLGLTLGLTISFAIALFVFDELSYDKYHKRNDIQRLEVVFESMNNAHLASTAGKMGPALKGAGYIEQYARLSIRNINATKKNTHISLDKLAFSDLEFIDFFKIDTIAGSLYTTLSTPNSIALNETYAIKFFGKTNIIGKTIELKQGNIVSVGAVFKNLPHNTHLDFNALSNLQTYTNLYGKQSLDSWFKNDFYTYVLLPKKQSASQVEKTINEFLKKPILQQAPQLKLHFKLQKVIDIHLFGHSMSEIKVNGDISQVYLFTSIALIILFMAIFNYINFSTALAGKRSKEVGLRQVLGASRTSLIQQFFGESFILVSLAFIFALIFSISMAPLLSILFERQLSITALFNLKNMVAVFSIYLITIFCSGFYCAFVLSGLPVISALKGIGFKGKSGVLFRNTMVFLQLTSAITLMILGSHIYLQLKHIDSQPIGYDKENIIILKNINSKNIQKNFLVFKNEFEKSKSIKTVSSAEHIPTYVHGNFLNIRNQENITASLENVAFTNIYQNFFKSLGIEIIAGNDFNLEKNSLQNASKQNSYKPVIINQLAANAMGWSNASDAIGNYIELGFDKSYNNRINGKVIAVVAPYYFTSVHSEQQPMVYITGRPYQNNAHLIVSFKENEYINSISHLRKLWAQITNDAFPRFELLNSRFNSLHQQDRLKGRLVEVFTILAIIIVTFGLIGLSSYSSQRRLREFAVRQILGASKNQLTWLLGKEFLIILIISSFAASFLSFWLTGMWLSEFTDPINQSLLPYLGAPLVVSVIICVIFSFVLHLLMKVDLVNVLKCE